MNKRIIYLLIAATLAMPQLLKAQNVGIGTTTPTTTLEVSSHKKAGMIAATDSAMGHAWNHHDYITLPAGLKGEYKATGEYDGSGVMGVALTPDAGYGAGVTGVGNEYGVVGIGQTGGQAAVMAVSNGADHALKVLGSTQLYGIMYTTADVYSQGALVANEDIVSYDSVIAETVYALGGIATDGTIQIAGGNPVAGKVLTCTDASGTATWQALPLPTPTSKIMSISFAAFTTTGTSMSSIESNVTNGSWVSMASGTPVTAKLYAPVNLPDGATVTRVKAFYVNNTTNTVSLTLIKNNFFTTVMNPISISNLNLTGTSTAIVNTISPTLNHLVSNVSSQYYLYLSTTTAWSGINNFKLGWVEITYTN